MDTGMILRGARIALDARTTDTVSLTVQDGRVFFSDPDGPRADLRPRVLDLTGFLVLPGLINAHDHLEFNLFPSLGHGIYPNAKSWAADVYQPSTSPVKEHLALSKRTRLTWGGLKNLLSGVTTVSHHNPFEPAVFDAAFPVNVVERFGWAHSLDFTPDLAERFRTTPDNWPFIIHAAEGVDAHARSEVGRLDELGVLSERTVLVHAIGLDQPDLHRLRHRRSSLVWCPSSNVSTYGQTVAPDALHSGLRIALGTDSALTAQVDPIDEIAVARRTRQLAPEELFEMVTSRSACILRLTDGEGTIRQGGAADLVIVEDRGQTPAEALHELHPEMVIVRGTVRLVSPRLRGAVKDLDDSRWNSISVEGKGHWFTDVNVRALHSETVSVLGTGYRLAGRSVSA
jgi:cytosine/adenosine deaminase-related metal-dependent hydrolase